ncbi:cardiolipin synthase [Olivibacter ginsenosidimutans]|uniref:Cardiolipin synthase n=1 Tax=Olivibacter ginsenosidimutans TaxID=1176537 RepID=A0ABP9BSP9_9SPHI
MKLDWFLIYEVVYVIVAILVCLRIVYDTRNNTKTLAYLLLVIFLPIVGIIFYFSFGINYRKRKMYSKKLVEDENLTKRLADEIVKYSKTTFDESREDISQNKELMLMLLRDSMSPLTANNAVKLLINGENKFPEVIQALRDAKNHIHIEYYIYEDDEIGQTIEQLLLKKVQEGITVRFIYDDFGSSSIRRRLVKRLKEGGVQVFPFSRVLFIAFANRLNYRNHRKIIVVDGKTAFVGGINVSDRYINNETNPNKLFWRDTHLRIDGPGVQYLQHIFLCDWNFCSDENLRPNATYFPKIKDLPITGNKVVQIAASGPDSDTPLIMYSLLQAINLATKEILITTPYFIPDQSLVDGLTIAALSGVSVKLLLPGISDSWLVNLAAHSYYQDLLKVGIEIYQYKKGFVHSKTMVTDRSMAMVGSANMDNRSFDLNFEVNAIVYDTEIAMQLRDAFFQDLKDAEKIDAISWGTRP